jgi:hypothetical protein
MPATTPSASGLARPSLDRAHDPLHATERGAARRDAEALVRFIAP